MNQSEILNLFTDEEKDILFDIPMSNDIILDRKEYRLLKRILNTEHLRSEYNWHPDTYSFYQESNYIVIANYLAAGRYHYNPVAGVSSDDSSTSWTPARDLNTHWNVQHPQPRHPVQSLINDMEFQMHVRAARALERSRRREHRQLLRLRQIEALHILNHPASDTEGYETE